MYRNGPVSAVSVRARGRTIVRSVTAAVGAGGVAAAGVIALVLPGGATHAGGVDSTSTARSPGASRPHRADPSSTPSSRSPHSSTGSSDSTSSSGSSGFNTGNPPSPGSGSSSATSGGTSIG
jgi:hypothetical protein